MKIALLGATGFVGSAILNEALVRGHAVTAIVRHPEKVEQHEGLIARQGDAYDAASLAQLLTDQDANMKPGNRTGKYRVGGNQLLVAANGKSEISVQDYAVAMIDELEHPAHVRQRFTVGY